MNFVQGDREKKNTEEWEEIRDKREKRRDEGEKWGSWGKKSFERERCIREFRERNMRELGDKRKSSEMRENDGIDTINIETYRECWELAETLSINWVYSMSL